MKKILSIIFLITMPVISYSQYPDEMYIEDPYPSNIYHPDTENDYLLEEAQFQEEQRYSDEDLDWEYYQNNSNQEYDDGYK
jgi:hypothetical protein